MFSVDEEREVASSVGWVVDVVAGDSVLNAVVVPTNIEYIYSFSITSNSENSIENKKVILSFVKGPSHMNVG